MLNGVGGAVGPGESLRTQKQWFWALMAMILRSFRASPGVTGVSTMGRGGILAPTGPAVGGGMGLNVTLPLNVSLDLGSEVGCDTT